MFKLAIAGLGWWGKVIITRLSTSKNIKIVFLIDPKPDSDAVKLAANKKIPIFDEFEETLLNNKVDGIVLCTCKYSSHETNNFLCQNWNSCLL